MKQTSNANNGSGRDKKGEEGIRSVCDVIVRGYGVRNKRESEG